MDKDLILSWIEDGMIQIPRLLMVKYKHIGLNETELVLLLQVFSFLEKGNDFPTPAQLSERMTIPDGMCASLLRRLVQNQYISIEEGYSEENIRYEKYSLKPLWSKLIDEFTFEKKQAELEHNLHEETNLYTIFEQEFGRPLSPLECETLAMWLDQDHQDPSVIKAALREAVISGKLNFRYIDRILFEWKKNGIKTIEQAKDYGNKFRQQRKKTTLVQKSDSKTIPFYNWLEQ
ncbi:MULTISPECIES: DnaD domain-containing protein [Heyndrickxia]|jgi:DNA replication protein|uniref:DnaD domain-containing protein n=1 Tax=Heyndrickxia TaxID=2837504 RepID=UPI0007171C57|nr:DnaD domain-containing protein [Heyndrickxia oleronia]MCI1593553.1 DnaD domain-containing protein [Heyndrickxia oleronia]MCI1612318.1 DnaD domain-containing protein [Heyndrickxia oleronia]MCI1746543.1 DnaD domain-containing protein [Heyndrickxia oleronia]MCI1761941.1 DnaD domain-containing protein [Heyndrickxia oleronia]GIN38152.1 DNA replication protein [Heyndrickxia oleronia]